MFTRNNAILIGNCFDTGKTNYNESYTCNQNATET